MNKLHARIINEAVSGDLRDEVIEYIYDTIEIEYPNFYWNDATQEQINQTVLEVYGYWVLENHKTKGAK